MRTHSLAAPAMTSSMVVMPPSPYTAVMAMIPSTDNQALTPSMVALAMTA